MTSEIDFSNPLTINRNPFKQARSTIIVSLFDSSITPVEIQKILEAGANVVKLQLSQTTKRDKMVLLGKVDKASLTCCMKYGVSSWPVATCIDLKTCIVKTGLLKEGAGSINVNEGSVIKLTNNILQYNKCDAQEIFIDNCYMTSEVKVGTEINIAQGEIILKCVEIIDDNSIKCVVTKGGQLSSLDIVTTRGIKRQRSSLTKIDYQLIKFALENQVNMLLIQYVRRAETLSTIKKFMGNTVKRPFLISGICTQEGLENIDEITKESDAIMLSRDYLPYELETAYQYKLSVIQKWLGAKCRKFGMPYFISGGIFKNCLTTGISSHREESDVANALLDGATGFILKTYDDINFTVDAVRSVDQLCRSIEPLTHTTSGFWRLSDEVTTPLNAAEACVLCCVFAAYQARTRVIIIPTVSGGTARALLRMNPECLIITVSTDDRVTRMLNNFRSLISLKYTKSSAKSWKLFVEERLNFAVEYAVKRGCLMYGDMYVTLQRGTEMSAYCDTVRLWTTKISKKTLVECENREDIMS